MLFAEPRLTSGVSASLISVLSGLLPDDDCCEQRFRSSTLSEPTLSVFPPSLRFGQHG